jgi:RHS repeat-associated protein
MPRSDCSGRGIATRISGDQEGDNGLFYIHSDHLGSTSVMSYGQGHGSNSGNKVDDSTARYLPFGNWRVEPSHKLTDQGFTGQKHNMDLGLYYYNARFYLPYINRFISADSIVPDSANPQSFNRYSYVLNNPLRFIDPTGHFSEEAIYNYLLNNHCGASPICADDIMTEWSQNSEWWSMLLTAEAGDILFGAYGVLSGVKDGGFAFRFTGNGATELTAIIASDMFGNGANLLLPDSDRVNLQNQ